MPNWDLPCFDNLQNLTLIKDQENQEQNLTPTEQTVLTVECTPENQLELPQTTENIKNEDEINAHYQHKFNEGYQAGLLASKQQNHQLTQELQHKIQFLQDLITQFEQNFTAQIPQIEKALLQLISHIARSVIGHELSQSSSQQRLIIKQALRQIAPNCEQFKIKVNPQDISFATELSRHIAPNCTIISDETLSVGGCIVSTADNLIDASIEQRLHQILAHLA